MALSPVLCRISISALLPLSFFTVYARRSHSQASTTASKTSRVSLFGAYSLVSPDDRGSGKNNGFTFGGDYTLLLPHNFAFSIEPRVTVAPGSVVGENTYGGGPRLEWRIKNFAPYADYIWSYGVLTLTHPTSAYVRDNSTVHSLGFGLDYNLTQQWAARADYQFEHWHVAVNNTFEPRVLSFGVVYTIPFRPYKPH
jgi:hypothetical protein